MDESLLLELSKQTIKSKFDNNIKLDKDTLLLKYPYLNEQKAVFVTLTINGKLRGCIGSLIAYRTLYEDLIYNSNCAAFEDPRFKPLSRSEFENIKIELSILDTPKDLTYTDFEDLEKKLIDKPGVILELDNKKATFLPQVWEQLDNFNDFMANLCIKASLDPQNLKRYPNIKTYNVKKIKEVSNES